MQLVIDNTDGSQAPLVIGSLPDVKRTVGGGFRQSQPLTRRNVEYVLGHMGVAVRFDVMAHAVVFSVGGMLMPLDAVPALYQALCDVLVKLDISALGRLDELLSAIARDAAFHPMEEWLRGLVWDGCDRLDLLASAVITANPLWPVYLENWLIQVVQGVCGWREPVRGGLPHVLVLVGAQGLGKTHFWRLLGRGWLRNELELHLGSAGGKDHQIQALKWPMGELSELDGVFRKADVAHLKAFLSRETDEIREPYARRALIRPRMTCFCGTGNEVEFLADSGGSRRFWPVLVECIDWKALNGLDFDQVWAQVFDYWREDPQFSLNATDDALRVQLAEAEHTVVSGPIEKLGAYLDHFAGQTDDLRPMNRTDIMDMLGYRNCSPKTLNEAGALLIRRLGKMRKVGTKQRVWMVHFSEFAHDSSMWR